jgi:pimeloyl-ACP methyl ester carboxylesterase
MKQELVRINSMDNIEMVGILYEPEEKSNKIVIHVHGLCGNFYENRFLDILAKTYTDKGISFLTFNNRGVNYISDLRKENGTELIGGCYERFIDSLLDIEGAINFVKEKGYTNIILEGHSYGCNKVAYYYSQKKDKNISKIVLLAPCDIPRECEKFLSKAEYEKAKEESTRLVNEGKENELIDFSVNSNGVIAAGTYYNDFLPNGENDFIRYVDGKNGKSEVFNNIDIPVLVIFGDVDECVLTEDIETIKGYLNNNIKNCNIQIIKGANHSYTDKYGELGRTIENNI